MLPAPQNKALLSIGLFRNDRFRAFFENNRFNVFKGYTSILGTRDCINALYYIDLPTPTSPVRSKAYSAYDMMKKANLGKSLHHAAFSSVVSTWTKTINAGYFTTCPGLTSELVPKHLPKSLATAKGYLKKTKQKVWSTKIVTPPLHHQFLTLANSRSEATKYSSIPSKSLENVPPIK